MTLRLIVTCFALCTPVGVGLIFALEYFKHPVARISLWVAAFLLFDLIGVIL